MASTLRAVLALVLAALLGCATGGRSERRTSRDSDAGTPLRDAEPVSRDGGDGVDSGPGADCTTDAECDDGLACTGTERCAGGRCATDPHPGCDDGVACTVDRCGEPGGECTQLPDHTMCPGTQICDATEGCVSPPPCTTDAECNDGVTCNGAETCDPALGCRSGTPVSCDDGVACTTDVCNEPGGTCTHQGTDADRDGHVAAGCAGGDDCNDSAAAVHPGAAEVCDGIDNDCDGAPDDGYDCVLGSGTGSCTTTCGTAGTRTCNATCGFGPCAAASETCGNGCDDDLNGVADDGCGPPAPPNDGCGGAISLSGSGTRSSDTLAGATAQTTDCGSGVEVFYRVSVSQRSIVYLDTFGTGFDTRISYRGTSCPGASSSCMDDSCSTVQTQIAVVVPAGTHYFAVHTYSSFTTGGPITMRYQILPAAGGDNTAITAGGTFTGSTSGTGAASASCGSGAGSPEDAFYWMQCPSDSRSVTATTCTSTTTYDTVLHLHGASGELACNDDASCTYSSLRSQVSATTSGAGVFRVFVDGFGSSGSGTYGVTITW